MSEADLENKQRTRSATMRPNSSAYLRSSSTPRLLVREKYRQNKIYRAPPTPPLEKQMELERSFVLDSIAVSNISQDYSRANPKLGSAIPPYNSLGDRNVSNYFKFEGVPKLLAKTMENNESIAGKTHDKFYSDGAGFKYLSARNHFGNGHHPETVDGHSRYMGDALRVMIGYNNMYGYRRNVPKLRNEPPSTFYPDPRWLDRIQNSYKNHYTDEEIIEHFKHTHLIGYPFHDNNYNSFHPSVKYIITVKIGNQSPSHFEGNLGINIVAKNFDTGFIKLDENILVESNSLKPDADSNASSDPLDLFKSAHRYVFQFEDQDIRTISAIILSRDIKGDEILYIDYVNVEIQKTNEKQFYKFPFDGWLRAARQDKKSEELKARFGKKNSIVSFPNEKPKYEYQIRISPQMSKSTEYKFELNYEINGAHSQTTYLIEFMSNMPESGQLALRLSGNLGESSTFYFDDKTEACDDNNKLLFEVSSKLLGKIKHVTVVYENSDKHMDYFLNGLKIIDDSDGQNYVVELDQSLKASKEKVVKAKATVKTETEGSKKPGKIKNERMFVMLKGQAESTSYFQLTKPVGSDSGVWTFKKKESFIANLQSVKFKFEGKKEQICRIKSVKITSDNGHEFLNEKTIDLKNKQELLVNDQLSDEKKNIKNVENKDKRKLRLKLLGDKNQTDLFTLSNPQSNEQQEEGDFDQFLCTENDLGRIKNVFLQFDNESKTKSTDSVNMKYVEIIDPRGNTYKFVMDLVMNAGESVTLPRKNIQKLKDSSDQPVRNNVQAESKQSKNLPIETERKPQEKEVSEEKKPEENSDE